MPLGIHYPRERDLSSRVTAQGRYRFGGVLRHCGNIVDKSDGQRMYARTGYATGDWSPFSNAAMSASRK